MIIHSKGYDLVFVQKQRSRDESDHEFTYIYKFKSELNRYIDMFGVTSADLKNLSVAALIGQMMGLTDDGSVLGPS